jgi:hypothetical protein
MQTADTSVRPGTKQTLLIDLLKREEGATIDGAGQSFSIAP